MNASPSHRRLSKVQRWSFFLLLALSLSALVWMFGAAEFTAKWFAARAIGRRDYRSAQSWAERAYSLNQQDPEAEFLLARVARKLGRLDESLQHLKRADAMGIDRERVVREGILAQAQVGQLDEIADELPKLLMNQQGDGAEICEAFTNGFLANGQEREALTIIESWRMDYPHDPLPDYLWGRLAEHNRRTQEAEKHFRAALQRDPKHAMSVFGLARVMSELNRWQEAADLYQTGLASPVPGPAQMFLARCLRNLGREDEALALLKKAAQTDSTSFSEELRRLGQSTESDLLATELGTLEAQQGHHQEAIRWLRRAVQHNPKHREARYQLAQSLNAVGQTDEAQSLFKIILENDEKIREVDRLHDVILQHPDDLEARFRLGRLVYETSSEPAGLFWLRSVLARDPHHQGAQDAVARHMAREAAGKSASSDADHTSK